MSQENSLRSFIVWWNNTYPLDFWYRQKHKIRFNSPEHRSVAFIDILMEWEEQNSFVEYRNQQYIKKEIEEARETGDWFRRQSDKMTEEEVDRFLSTPDESIWDKLDDEDEE